MSEAVIARLDMTQSDFEAQFSALMISPFESDTGLTQKVADILQTVASEGDAAVTRLTNEFDQRDAHNLADLTIQQEALDAALVTISPDLRDALALAAERIRDFHQRQLAESWQYEDGDGNLLGQRVSPLDRVGVYVPGGRASYPSSVLMNTIPAKVAGVADIVMVAPAPHGEINPVVLAAASLAGVNKVYSVGGAQAIAALAYGTETIAKVDKIVGPGNRFVAEAKRQVFGRVGIDMVAGPSEILIIADGTVDPEWVTMDLFAQAEHDEYAQAILISPDQAYLDEVHACIDRKLPQMSRRDIISVSLQHRGALVKVPNLTSAVALSNRLAPEHLELAVAEPHALLDQISAAGAIFMGAMSSESLGDYCAGPNHVLPTSGSARFASPLGVYDFQRRSSLIGVSAAGAQLLGDVAAKIADAESLEAHSLSAQMRMPDAH
ncbi:histidinol dehydrogenase [Luminiphilus sp.]|jgi:histidinol dehydrogenase|nr:histidinol dehydrogenase [Luminiphilus sp.]MDA9191293.1 histidinol dehydrogenase [bacterium]